MVGAFSQPGPWVSLLIGVKDDRPKPNLPKWKGVHPFRCSVWVCKSANILFRTGQCLDKTALFRAHCKQVPKTHHSSAEHRRPYCKQDECSSSPCYAVWGTRHPTAGHPLHWCREVGTFKLPTSWVFFKQEAWPCHVCPRATKIHAFGPISTDIGDRVVGCVWTLMAIKYSTSTNHRQRDCEPWIFQCFLTPVCTLAILTVVMLTEVTMTTVRAVSAWLTGQVLIVLPCYIMPRTLPVSIPDAGTLAPIWI